MTSGLEPRDPQPLVDRFVAACVEDDRIVAAFLGGSHARGVADVYSDVDLCVIARDDAHEELAASRDQFVRRLGEPLFLEDFGIEGMMFFILADGTEGEIFFGKEGALDELEPGPYRTLFDRTGILDGVTFAEELPDEAAQREVLRQTLMWFWHELSHFIAAIGRGHLWWAAGQLEALRGHCVNLTRLEQSVGAGEEPYEKVDVAIRTADLSPLTPTFVPLERHAMLDAALEVFRFYRERAPLVAEAHRMAYPRELELIMVGRLDDLASSMKN